MTVYILRDIQTSLWLLTSVLRAHDFGWVEIKVKLIIKKTSYKLKLKSIADGNVRYFSIKVLKI